LNGCGGENPLVRDDDTKQYAMMIPSNSSDTACPSALPSAPRKDFARLTARLWASLSNSRDIKHKRVGHELCNEDLDAAGAHKVALAILRRRETEALAWSIPINFLRLWKVALPKDSRMLVEGFHEKYRIMSSSIHSSRICGWLGCRELINKLWECRHVRLREDEGDWAVPEVLVELLIARKKPSVLAKPPKFRQNFRRRERSTQKKRATLIAPIFPAPPSAPYAGAGDVIRKEEGIIHHQPTTLNRKNY
jgi:hypothetical protein